MRERLRAGDVVAATELLGHPPTLEGEVVHGDHLGRKLGFPTANLAIDPLRLLPPDGVYAARVLDPARPGAMSIGTRPAVGGTDRRVEVHLLDFDGDLYGRTLRVELVDWLHEQRKYDSLDDLIAGIGRDVEEVRQRVRA